MKNTLFFIFFVLVIVGILYFISGKKYPQMPSNLIHSSTTVDMCNKCHGPKGKFPKKPAHPPKVECFKCHKTKRIPAALQKWPQPPVTEVLARCWKSLFSLSLRGAYATKQSLSCPRNSGQMRLDILNRSSKRRGRWLLPAMAKAQQCWWALLSMRLWLRKSRCFRT